MNKRKLMIIIGSVVLVLIIAAVIIFIQKCSKDEEDIEEEEIGLIEDLNSLQSDQRRLNILRLAERYAQAGEFDRALNLIDGLLIENPDDEDAIILQRTILSIDRSGGTDALLQIQQRLLEQQMRQTQALANMNRNNNNQGSNSYSSSPSSGFSSSPSSASSSSSAANSAASAAVAAEAAAVRRAAEEEERRRVQESLQAVADTSQGISSGAESVQFYDNLPDID